MVKTCGRVKTCGGGALRAAVALSVLLIGGCAVTPHLDFVWKNEITDDEMIRDAPIIIIGKVIRQTPIGPVQDSYRLVRVTTSVENTVKGQVPSETITFNFYMPWLGATGDLNVLQDDKRYIFFLMCQNGVLRAVRDVWRSNIRMYSGKHRTLPLNTSQRLPEQIAMILLTPGEEFDPAEFSVGLLHATPYAWQYLGRWRTAELLIHLLNDEHQAVRIGACEELTLHYDGIDRCWQTVDFGDGSSLRSRYGVISPQVTRTRHRYWTRETRDAEAWWAMAVRRHRGEELLDELRLLTMADDVAIRSRFCALLQKKYPDQRCSGISKFGQ